MLTAKHVAVIRAALMFWDEEMSPHDPAVSAPYLDQPIGTGEWIKHEVAFLRDRLVSCQLRYVLCSPDGMSLVNNQVFESIDQAQAAIPGSSLVASILIFQTEPNGSDD